MVGKIVIVVLCGFLAVCSGCSRKEEKFITTSQSGAMAKDAAWRLKALYHPARTKVVYVPREGDKFGLTFVDELRSQGYQVEESADAVQGALNVSYTNYLVDESNAVVQVNVNGSQLARMYDVTDLDTINPVSYWVNKEQ
jgi:Conjugal transfer protein TrbH.